MTGNWRLAVDIGGTFTDVVLARGDRWITHKRLTTHGNPAVAVLDGARHVLQQSGVAAASVDVVLHGTTLATNALIERRGARTALITTEGHRDVLEIGLENRFDQYDIFMQRPAPLVPRALRFTVRERVGARGEVLLPLTAAEVDRVVDAILDSGAESIAIGLLHAWIEAGHEHRLAEAITHRAPWLPLSLSSLVCPEIREYERFSTTVANAYVKPLMAAYLRDLQEGLRSIGLGGPVLVMTSGGGLTSLSAAQSFPVRLVESGPAGGAMLAAALARRSGLARVLAFDMGGTTAKLTLIDEGEPEWSRTFEVARAWKFRKGSGMPVRIPVIELVEIGAGGGSIAAVDRLGRIQVGPHSAGSEPGPAAYDRGGEHPTVTDADLVLGRLQPDRFAAGSIPLRADKAANAIRAHVATVLGVDPGTAARGIADTVGENMAAAARNHAGEWGRDLSGRTLIAFGGSAPLHAAELARRLGIERVMVPVNAGVGSAVGFLLSPMSFEVVRSRHVFVDAADEAELTTLFAEMRAEALEVVRPLTGEAELRETLRAWMRYVGQGHEIPVTLPVEVRGIARQLERAFGEVYRAIYGRLIPGQRIEVLSWTLSIAGPTPVLERPEPAATGGVGPSAEAPVQSAARGLTPSGHAVVERDTLRGGQTLRGPLLVVEDQTTTVVPANWTVSMDDCGQILLTDVSGRNS